MRQWPRWPAAAVLAAVASVSWAGPAAAHPTDEVVQQLYVTPAASGLTVQLDLTPGVLVGPRFAGTVDADGNGTASSAEIESHLATVRSAVTVQVDGNPVDLTLAEQRYPPVELLAAGGGTVTLMLIAPMPADAHQLVVTDTYETGIKTVVQMSVLVPPDPIPLGPSGTATEAAA